MGRAADKEAVGAIHQVMLATTGVLGMHDTKTCRMGDIILVGTYLEVNAYVSVHEGHDIALKARRHMMERRDVLNPMTHVGPVDVFLQSQLYATPS